MVQQQWGLDDSDDEHLSTLPQSILATVMENLDRNQRLRTKRGPQYLSTLPQTILATVMERLDHNHRLPTEREPQGPVPQVPTDLPEPDLYHLLEEAQGRPASGRGAPREKTRGSPAGGSGTTRPMFPSRVAQLGLLLPTRTR